MRPASSLSFSNLRLERNSSPFPALSPGLYYILLLVCYDLERVGGPRGCCSIGIMRWEFRVHVELEALGDGFDFTADEGKERLNPSRDKN